MKKTLTQAMIFLLILSFALVGCAPNKNTPTIEGDAQAHLVTGSYMVTNDFVLTQYYVENSVGLTDMHGFVTRDQEWELPVDAQILGYMTFDPEALTGAYELNLPALPRGEFNDVDNDQKEEQGVQIFAVAYSPNLTGGPFATGDDRSRGWPSYLASVKTDSENDDEVVGGKLIVWSPDDQQGFPSGFGNDGLLFTADDPTAKIPAGYTVVDLDTSPFTFIQNETPDLTLYEPQDIAVKDFSTMSYTGAFDAMFETVRKEYAFTDVEGKAPNWDELYRDLRPRIEDAEKNKDPNAFYLALRDFTWAFQDGHVGLSAGDYAQQDFATATAGGYGFAIRELDDERSIAIFVMEGGPAQAAGMQVGAEILEFNGKSVYDAIGEVQPYSIQSSDFAIRYQQARYLLAARPGDEATVTFINPNSAAQTVTLTAIEERQSFGRTSLNFGVDRTSFDPVDAKIINSGNARIGYVRINSNSDDLNLTIRLFERALQRFAAAEAAGIVIDMRYNNGGAPLGLAGFLTDQEILMGQLEYFSDQTGKFEPRGLRDKILPNEAQYRFDKTVLFVGAACFSACEIEAYGFSQVPGMIVVGVTPTGGVEAETARGKFNLPEGFSLTVPTGRMTLPDGSIFLEGHGVQPTLRVPTDETTVLASNDIVLQAGIDAVLQPIGSGVAPSKPPKIASLADSESAFTSGVSFLEDLAHETYESSAFAQPGSVTYTIAMDESTPVVWAYVWCAKDAQTLTQNFESIQLSFKIEDEESPLNSFNIYELETSGKVCRLTYAVLTDWTPGEHHLTATATFSAPINDGGADYPAGEYVLNYTVFVKP